ncbi:hypothetical protein [Bacillus coahuilensis]|nr:hypothetical protein [Bacillus coahuilensis]
MSFHGHKTSITFNTCSCTISGLEQTIRERFRRGEPIGVTNFGE